jgi:hypothetical protein
MPAFPGMASMLCIQSPEQSINGRTVCIAYGMISRSDHGSHKEEAQA